MKNWAGNLVFEPLKVASPSSIEEIRDLILRASREKRKIRVRGSGHSWTGLIATQDYFLHLDQYQGILEVQKEKGIIKAKAGTKLFTFGQQAFKNGLAMENQGDINKQSLAGATSTGTHGTGLSLKSLSNQITSLKLLNGKGEEVSIDATHAAFNAARLSLGSLGILTEISFRLIPAYKLKVSTFAESYGNALWEFPDRLEDHRHLEMFYFPVGDWFITKIMNETKDPPGEKSWKHKFNEVVVENWLYAQMNLVASVTGKYEAIDRIMQKVVKPETKVDWSHKAFPSERSLKFMEMEYNLPVESFQSALEEIRSAIKEHQFKTLFPIEIRFVKGDDLWLSPAAGRDSVYFAVHAGLNENFRPYFDCLEKIFQKYDGRPHWGKWHTMKASQFKKTYPKFEEFCRLRSEFDPEGLFLNDHLNTIFGV